jgi:hypothetical protein
MKSQFDPVRKKMIAICDKFAPELLDGHIQTP